MEFILPHILSFRISSKILPINVFHAISLEFWVSPNLFIDLELLAKNKEWITLTDANFNGLRNIFYFKANSCNCSPFSTAFRISQFLSEVKCQIRKHDVCPSRNYCSFAKPGKILVYINSLVSRSILWDVTICKYYCYAYIRSCPAIIINHAIDLQSAHLLLFYDKFKRG